PRQRLQRVGGRVESADRAVGLPRRRQGRHPGPLRGRGRGARARRSREGGPARGADPLTNGVVETVDYHTAGEPFRIVTGGVPPLEGRTILEKRRFAAERADEVRRLLVFEPRGHADMYGCFVTEPEDDGADLGGVFFHNAGYSTAWGRGG